MTIYYNAPSFECRGAPWKPRVSLSGDFSPDFNTISVQTIPEGIQVVSSGKLLLWEMNLKLSDPFEKSQQKVEQHLNELNDELKEHTAGISLWNGSIDELVSQALAATGPADFEEWRKRNSLSETALSLAHYALACFNGWVRELEAFWQIEIPLFGYIDARSCKDTLSFLQLSNKARFEFIHLFWWPPSTRCPTELAWEEGIPFGGFAGKKPLILVDEPPIALSLPPIWDLTSESWDPLRKPLEWFEKRNISYKPIPQELLGISWVSVEIIITSGTSLTDSAKRYLEGFVASGGTLVLVDGFLGIGEFTWTEWSEKY